MTTAFMNVADIKCPDDPQGRTYRQINAEKKHSIPLGTLVEYYNGVRLFVVAYTRDCDQTPLYWLSPEKKDVPKDQESHKGWDQLGISIRWVGGCLEDNLTIVDEPRFVRTQVRVMNVVGGMIYLWVAGFKTSSPGYGERNHVVRTHDDLPLEIHSSLKVGKRLHAKVNTGATKPEDLIFKDWETE